MTNNGIRVNCMITEGADTILHTDLAARPIRMRARRLEQLAYLGLLHEKQMLAGITAPAQQTLQPPAVTPTVSAQKTLEGQLIPPESFGDDMHELFSNGMSLNVG